MPADMKDVSGFGTAGQEKSEVRRLTFSIVQRVAAVRELTNSSLNLLRTGYKLSNLKSSRAN